MAYQLSPSQKCRLFITLTCLGMVTVFAISSIANIYEVPFDILSRYVPCLVIAWLRRLPMRPFLFSAMAKIFLYRLEARQIQYLSSSTWETFNAWQSEASAKIYNLKAITVPTRQPGHVVEAMEEDGGSLLWLGDHNEASTVVLFLHGGGYIAPLFKGHLNWCRDVFLEAEAETGTKVAVAILEYTLCPEARFPTQLRQAIGAVNTLLSSGFPLEKILLGGDSVGGNLAAQLLCQIARPNALLPPIQTSRPLQATFMVSPWLSRHINGYSYQFNERIDMLSSHTVKKSVAYLMGDDHDNCSMCDPGKLASPIDSGTDCFQGLDTAVRHLYVTAGEQEVMKDQIVAFTKGVITFNPKINVEFIFQKEQAHDFILIEGQQGVPGICTEGMKAWVKSVLTS
ncbi:unnamed protein product [Clonostachys chloroleuca]|uniref:Alpha/beta hydrolase fold-3 domain-containing protein n=1 Tax=Clonostachys chloroleuca TaxID=1926264 RepID=A0AA35Q3H6_9HYPO|nr:unnamed protein product [Clonostachys chloroleuca]